MDRAMLMSAGLGTRLMPFTNFTTKSLIPVFGIPVVQFLLDLLRFSGVKKIVMNVHHHAMSAQKEFRKLDYTGSDLIISNEERTLLGGAGGLREALKLIGSEALFVLNSDIICDIDLLQLAEHHKKLKMKHGVVLTWAIFQKSPLGREYPEIIFDRNSLIMHSIKPSSLDYHPYFVGVAILEPEALSYVPEEGFADLLTSVVNPMIEKRKVGVFLTDGIWYDIGSPLFWLDTHIRLINRLETGFFPSPISKLWRKRIERENIRIQDRVWISKNKTCSLKLIKNWESPCYFHSKEEKKNVPNFFGPCSILYEPENFQKYSSTFYQNGIGFGGEWVSFTENLSQLNDF